MGWGYRGGGTGRGRGVKGPELSGVAWGIGSGAGFCEVLSGSILIPKGLSGSIRSCLDPSGAVRFWPVPSCSLRFHLAPAGEAGWVLGSRAGGWGRGHVTQA